MEGRDEKERRSAENILLAVPQSESRYQRAVRMGAEIVTVG